MHSDSTIRLLENVDKMYPSAGKIYIVLDNATYYHSGWVRDWLSRHKCIKLHYLPKASPNLNLIEQVWMFFNEKVRLNRYYESFELFMEAYKGFSANGRSGHAPDLAENFQRLTLTQFHNG